MTKCSVKICANNTKKIRKKDGIFFFKFPRKPERRAKWTEILAQNRCEKNFKPSNSSLVCSAHFSSSDIFTTNKGLKRLRNIAYPVLNLAPEPPAREVAPSAPACRACLATRADGRLYDIQENLLKNMFVKLSGQPFSVDDGLPRHLCAFCCTELTKLSEFRDKCQRTRKLLLSITKRPLSIIDMKVIDRKSHGLAPKLSQVHVHQFDSTELNLYAPLTLKIENENDETYNDGLNSFDIEFRDETPDKQEIYVKIEEITLEQDNNLLEENNALDADILNVITAKTTIPTETTVPTETAITTETPITTETTIATETAKPTKTTKATKRARTKSDNIKIKNRRKKMFDDDYPNFDYAAFEKRHNVKIQFLTLEQQKQDIENKKKTKNYMNSKHRCEMCGKGFSFEITLRNHMGYHDPSMGPVECEICHLRFLDKHRKLKHRDVHRLYFKCQLCGFATRDRQHSRRHYDTHQGKRHACAHCPETFACLSSCLGHARAAHAAIGVACALCGETYFSKLGVRHHMARAHRPCLQPKCDVCNVVFCSTEALEKHKHSVTEDNHHTHKPCLICGEHCDSEESLATHKDECHPPGQSRCDKCDESFGSVASLVRHTRRKHLGERSCLRTRTRARTRRPRAAHGCAGAMCEVCGKVLPNPTLLSYHQNNHKAKKPFACPHCEKTFAIKRTREWHILTHTGEKPFQCEECSQCFSIRSNLRRHHRVVHLGQRQSVPCPLCGKSLSSPSVLKLHVDTVHRGKPMPRRARSKTAKKTG